MFGSHLLSEESRRVVETEDTLLWLSRTLSPSSKSATVQRPRYESLNIRRAGGGQVLAEGGCENWTSRWLRVLKEQGRKGFHPTVPRFGFGDTTSYHVIEKAVDASTDGVGDKNSVENSVGFERGLETLVSRAQTIFELKRTRTVALEKTITRCQIGHNIRPREDTVVGFVQATKITGAVRHGAECFNYYFPSPRSPSLVQEKSVRLSFLSLSLSLESAAPRVSLS